MTIQNVAKGSCISSKTLLEYNLTVNSNISIVQSKMNDGVLTINNNFRMFTITYISMLFVEIWTLNKILNKI